MTILARQTNDLLRFVGYKVGNLRHWAQDLDMYSSVWRLVAKSRIRPSEGEPYRAARGAVAEQSVHSVSYIRYEVDCVSCLV